MQYYVGLDVSMDTTAICVISCAGEVVHEISVESRAEPIAVALKPYKKTIEAIGLEAGPMSEWLLRSLSDILCKRFNRHRFQIWFGILSSNMIAN